jgi:hypothetical protein
VIPSILVAVPTRRKSIFDKWVTGSVRREHEWERVPIDGCEGSAAICVAHDLALCSMCPRFRSNFRLVQERMKGLRLVPDRGGPLRQRRSVSAIMSKENDYRRRGDDGRQRAAPTASHCIESGRADRRGTTNLSNLVFDLTIAEIGVRHAVTVLVFSAYCFQRRV